MTRTFEQLTEAEKAKAVEIALTDLVGAVIEGSIRFNDTLDADDLQGRIDAAMGQADARQTPWFAAEYLRDDDYVWTTLTGMAQVSAEDAEYRTADDPYVVTL